MLNNKEKVYINNSILKPYLIHLEFEIENIISRLEIDKTLQEIIHKKGYNTTYIKHDLQCTLLRIELLIRILNK